MRFEPTTLFLCVKTGEDELGNPIYDIEEVNANYKSKITQWTSEEIALLDRVVTQNERKLLTTVPIDLLKQVERIDVGDVTYTITEVKSNFTRWRLAHVKEWKE